MALPTEGRHLLFAGEGTARFCNYWSKAISRIFFTVKALPEGISETDWIFAIVSAKPSGVVLAAAMATYYASEGTLLQFVRIPNIPQETEWRSALLQSMFLFSVAHEYAHLVAYETRPDVRGILSDEESQSLELWCDRLAIALCSHIGKRQRSIHAIAGLGAIAFFRVLHLCNSATDLLEAAGCLSPEPSSRPRGISHPSLERRIEAFARELIETAEPEDEETIRAHTVGFTALLETMHELAIALIKKYLTRQSEQPQRSSPTAVP
jgi:hypothetical protein